MGRQDEWLEWRGIIGEKCDEKHIECRKRRLGRGGPSDDNIARVKKSRGRI